ncbi:uncharacterized protein MYCFIDRAFT_84235 [Pseudocercospora fijiensis CIRAD86]|uniref:Uncharacterized protein n=1 Tax=Pseudocercospora fijiensis (strain CIRAD86) TaxID=383855 RepID=N1Q5M0_PSEFD|nr:uncharacterized protein MYCFIDRAFT_84235 [Pseudocercospora fijiensis CIRAD86]EME87169.1 hypothetical protein MYCFIDRAFT_84235 [Pseudocercospora fijiensis CIRAD86]
MNGRTAAGKTAGTGGEKAWASGRVLTAEQRARKQEVDRKANRFLKKEVQDRLALLEARVLQLEHTSTETRTANPNPGLSPHGIASSTSSNGAELSIAPDGSILTVADKVSNWNVAASVFDASHAMTSGSNSGGSVDDHYAAGHSVAGAPNDPDQEEFVHPSRAHPSNGHPELTGVYTAAKPVPSGRDVTMFLNNLVNHIRMLPPDRVCFEDRYNQDVIINAVLKGWRYSLNRYDQICPLWEVLQTVDLCLFKECNLIERLGCLRMLHKRYIFEIRNTPVAVEGPLPVWYQPHMTEKLIAHDPVIDHLTWPALRERLMSTKVDVLTNKFWALWVRNLKVAWQYEPMDVLALSSDSSLYQLSNQFEGAILNMANWRMDVNFFYDFPGLVDDIPAANYMPLRTLTPKFGLVERANADHRRQSNTEQQQQQQRRPIFPINTTTSQLVSQAQPDPMMYQPTGQPVHAWTDFYPFEAH